ncbi:MAG TPA: sulfatase/phosphatase domain-containing protein, partial [Sedimentisphaerales bacterium]|nr:sulfatase/phosphatase domain-containing protein [Sedimentisphaerales bacterium]
WGDHGRGLPRAKRWLYDSGLRVPLIIRVPEKWRKLVLPGNPDGPTGQALKPGSVNGDLVAFIDFAPTMLSLAGINIPDHIQGRAFLGAQKAKPRDYIYAARDRMDETYDLIRAVRDKRYKYIRNYMSHVTRGQDIEYMNEMPTMQEMRRLNAEGKLKGPQLQYFEPTKPVEELYDCRNDPHEVNNLAGDKKYQKILERMRKAHEQWVIETGDIGLIPESEFDEIKRPVGQYQTTADPVFWAADQTHIGVASPTPGASVVYRTGPSVWKLYSEPVGLSPGQTLRARACRIGFKDSAEVTFKIGDKIAAKSPEIKQADPDHWRSKVAPETFVPGGMLQRLRKIKALDGRGEKAILQYTEAINDEYAPVRYWAAVGLHTSCESQAQRESAVDALLKKLDDPSPVVRVAAAHALCDWAHDEQALPVLADALEDNNAKARLYAVTALSKIGPKARPVLPRIEAALKDSDEYVQRVARTTIKRL